eukprot:764165-Hanusia_phi.AAC.6
MATASIMASGGGYHTVTQGSQASLDQRSLMYSESSDPSTTVTHVEVPGTASSPTREFNTASTPNLPVTSRRQSRPGYRTGMEYADTLTGGYWNDEKRLLPRSESEYGPSPSQAGPSLGGYHMDSALDGPGLEPPRPRGSDHPGPEPCMSGHTGPDPALTVRTGHCHSRGGAPRGGTRDWAYRAVPGGKAHGTRPRRRSPGARNGSLTGPAWRHWAYRAGRQGARY